MHPSPSSRSVSSARAFVTSEQLDVYLREAESAGVYTADVLKSLGYRPITHGPGDLHVRFSLVDFFRIEGEIARRLDDLTAHLSERKLTFDTGAFVTKQVAQSTTLAEAISNFASYFNMMHGEHYNNVRVTDRTVTLIINDSTFPYTIKDDPEMVSFVGECVLIKVHCLLDSLTSGQAAMALRRVAVPRLKGKSVLGHLRFWEVPVQYGRAAYELSFDHDLAHSPITKPTEVDLSSEGVFSRVINYLQDHSAEHDTRAYRTRILELVRSGETQQDSVAKALSISVATLRRRLEEEQTSFRALVDQTRLENAIDLLNKGHSVSDVSDTLGYSDVRSFNRAFKRLQGETPAKFAKRTY